MGAPNHITAVTMTANEDYVVPAVILLESLRNRLPEDLEVVVRDAGLRPASRALLVDELRRIGCEYRLVSLELKPFSPVRLLAHWSSPAAFCRLLPLGYLSDHRYVLDLDVDLLVRARIDPLLSLIPAPDCVLSAVAMPFALGTWQHEAGSPADFGMNVNDNFFMGGVTVIDTESWSDAEVSGRAIELLTRDPSRWNGDLSVLNAVIGHAWTPIEPRWNVWTLATRGPLRFVRVSGVVERSIVRTDNARIAHFPGHFKPWKPYYPLNAWKVEYDRVARRSVLPRDLMPRIRLRSAFAYGRGAPPGGGGPGSSAS